MPRSLQKVGVLLRASFVVYDTNNAPVTGLVDGGFTKLLSLNGVNSAVVATVAEVTSGRYTVTFTPNATGLWQLLVRHATHNPRGWSEDFDVTTDGADVLGTTVDGQTVKNSLKLMAAALCGKSSGGPGTTKFRAMDDSAVRIDSVANADGDRTTVTLTP